MDLRFCLKKEKINLILWCKIDANWHWCEVHIWMNVTERAKRQFSHKKFRSHFKLENHFFVSSSLFVLKKKKNEYNWKVMVVHMSLQFISFQCQEIHSHLMADDRILFPVNKSSEAVRCYFIFCFFYVFSLLVVVDIAVASKTECFLLETDRIVNVFHIRLTANRFSWMKISLLHFCSCFILMKSKPTGWMWTTLLNSFWLGRLSLLVLCCHSKENGRKGRETWDHFHFDFDKTIRFFALLTSQPMAQTPWWSFRAEKKTRERQKENISPRSHFYREKKSRKTEEKKTLAKKSSQTSKWVEKSMTETGNGKANSIANGEKMFDLSDERWNLFYFRFCRWKCFLFFGFSLIWFNWTQSNQTWKQSVSRLSIKIDTMEHDFSLNDSHFDWIKYARLFDFANEKTEEKIISCVVD